MPTIAKDGHLTALRLERGAVLLDARRGSIVELQEEAASALDLVIFDRLTGLPRSEDEASRVRRVLGALRQELFDDDARPPANVEMDQGELLLRRHAEPESWSGRSAFVRATIRGPVLPLGLVRREDGKTAVAIAGRRAVVATVTTSFAEGAIHPGDVVLEANAEHCLVRTSADDILRPVEVWNVELGNREGLTLTRLAPARSLVKLLATMRTRPTEDELSLLALFAERVPHLGVLLPRNPGSLSRVVTEYFRAAVR